MMGSMEHGTPRGLAAFTRTMRGLLAVSHDELKEKMKAYEKQKKRKSKRTSASRASADRR